MPLRTKSQRCPISNRAWLLTAVNAEVEVAGVSCTLPALWEHCNIVEEQVTVVYDLPT